jgi:hypothetical protein
MRGLSAAKAEELQVVARVTVVRGGCVVEETGQWPDAWIESGDDRIPVEVVRAYERPPGEHPSRGAAVAKALATAEREATKRTAEDGKPRAYGAHAAGHTARGYVVDLTADEPLPLPLNPANPVGWILQAVVQKIAKRYGPADRTLLVVDYQWMAPSVRELREVGNELERLGCPFIEVWVVPLLISNQEEAAMRVPMRPVRRPAACTGPCRTPIPGQAEHPFRRKPNTDSGPFEQPDGLTDGGAPPGR